MGESEQRFSSSYSQTKGLLLFLVTLRGSCTHPDQSLELARAAQGEGRSLGHSISSSFYPFSCRVV